MDNIIIIALILLIVGGASAYLIRAKKRGVKCIGCPNGENCAKKAQATGCSGSCEGCSCCSDKHN